jgi:hypothetical protein
MILAASVSASLMRMGIGSRDLPSRHQPLDWDIEVLRGRPD